jgi:hypothetical protein
VITALPGTENDFNALATTDGRLFFDGNDPSGNPKLKFKIGTEWYHFTVLAASGTQHMPWYVPPEPEP